MATQSQTRGGGKKLRRSGRHTAKYAAQRLRTARNKANQARRRERKADRRRQ